MIQAPCISGQGLADHPRDAARVFRATLDAMARPGRIREVGGVIPPPGLSAGAASLLLCLADADSPVWLPPALRAGEAGAWLRFHTNAPQAAPEQAVFAVGDWETLIQEDWPIGDPAYPDHSATLLVEVESLTAGRTYSLTGPGIDGSTAFAPSLPEAAADTLRANSALYPLGLDFIFVAGAEIAALPRSTKIGAEICMSP